MDYHRIIMPLVHMEGVDINVTNSFSEDNFTDIDIFMYNRRLSPDAKTNQEYTERLYAYREKYGFKICLDIDDYWELDPHHILYKSYIEEGFATKQIDNIINADVVFTTHDRLLEKIYEFNKNVHIIPNAIPKKGQFDIERIPHHLTRIFWQGSVTHEEDIQLLARPIECLRPVANKIKMILAGHELDNNADIWERICHSYTAGFQYAYKIIPGVPVTNYGEPEKGYYASYAEADICVIPLLNSPFNRMKSNLKVLEAANLGLPVICSNVHPYKDLPVLYANNSTDWVNHITRLVKSRKRQKDAGEELKEFCNKNFNFKKINNQRKQIFEFQMSLV